MYTGRVVGTATATVKHPSMAGARLLLVMALKADGRTAEGDPILGGERKGLLIEGFDLGNSPQEYTADRVKGRGVVFTTTNGTKAMAHVRAADRILIGAFVNVLAVFKELVDQQ